MGDMGGCWGTLLGVGNPTLGWRTLFGVKSPAERALLGGPKLEDIVWETPHCLENTARRILAGTSFSEPCTTLLSFSENTRAPHVDNSALELTHTSYRRMFGNKKARDIIWSTCFDIIAEG